LELGQSSAKMVKQVQNIYFTWQILLN